MSSILSLCCCSAIWYSLAFIISIAYSRFCSWLRWVWQLVTMPVGLWIRRTAEDVLLMCWPPAPEERNTCISMSLGLISIWMFSSSSGITSRLAKLVWRRALASNGLMRTRRCTPCSLFSMP